MFTYTGGCGVVNVGTGLAHVCVVTECMTLTRARIEVHIPRKRLGSCENHDKVGQLLFS